MVVGLDVSTAIVGITALGDDGELRRISHVDLRKIDANRLCDKCAAVREELLKFREELQDGENAFIFVEAAAKQVRDKTSAMTLFKLSRFNGMVSYMAYEVFGFDSEPVEVAVSTARKTVGWKRPSIPKGSSKYAKEKIVKESVINLVLAEHTEDEVGFIQTAHGNWQQWCGDRADSYVIAKHGVLKS